MDCYASARWSPYSPGRPLYGVAQNLPRLDIGSIAMLQFINTGLYLRNRHLFRQFRKKMGYFPNVAFPRNYNEKILWRKIFDRNPLFGRLSDKLEAKHFFRQNCPDLGIVEVLWEGERAEDIPDKILKRSVVVKTNHGSTYNLFLPARTIDRDDLNARVNRWLRQHPDGRKSTIDRDDLNARVNRWLQQHPYGRGAGEWAYSQVTPKVYVEPLLTQSDGTQPLNFRFHAFHGRAIHADVFTGDPHGSVKAGVFNLSGCKIEGGPYDYRSPEQQLPTDFEMPDAFFVAAESAARLSHSLDYVRVDFLCCDGVAYGSEFTFYHAAGYGRWTNPDISRQLSAAWDLKQSWFLSTPQRGWKDGYAKRLKALVEANK